MTITTPKTPIAVTGCGWVTPAGSGEPREVLNALAARIGRPPECAYRAIPEAELEQHPEFGQELREDKTSWVTAVAFKTALRQAGLDPAKLVPERAAFVLGNAFAGQMGMIGFAEEVRRQSARFVSPIHFPQTVGNYAAGAIARAFSVRGPNITLASGPASGLDAIIEACGLLEAMLADVAVAGGVETLSDELVTGLDRSPPGPAGADRAILSEGACLLTLERREDAARRGGRSLAAIRAWSSLAEWNDVLAARTARWLEALPDANACDHVISVNMGPSFTQNQTFPIAGRVVPRTNTECLAGTCFAAQGPAQIAELLVLRAGRPPAPPDSPDRPVRALVVHHADADRTVLMVLDLLAS